MNRTTASLVLAAVLVATAASAAKTSAWKSPAAEGRSFKNLAVFAITFDDAIRRAAENSFAMKLKGQTKATPAYTFTSRDDLKSKDTVVAKVKEGGYDGVVVFRVIAVDQEETQHNTYSAVGYSTPYYGGFGNYWGGYGVAVYNSGTYTTKEQIVQIETTLYALSDDKLLWAGQTKVKDPESTLDLIDEIVASAISGLKKDKLIR